MESHAIATDGKILIVAEGLGAGLPTAHPSIITGVTKFREQTERYVDSIPIPPTPFETPACDQCNGTGYILEGKCPDCDGKGSFERGHCTYNCEYCEGDGIYVISANRGVPNAECCDVCNGTGIRIYHRTEIGNTGFQTKYLALLASLPNCLIRVGPSETSIAKFDFHGGYGFLMPMRAQ